MGNASNAANTYTVALPKQGPTLPLNHHKSQKLPRAVLYFN